MNDKREIRTRFAPSPTGELHIGGLRTALNDYFLARKNKGKFILRIEDTDQKRLVEGAVERLVQSLKWGGIRIDEGINLDNKNNLIETGDYGPYTQSKRLTIYKKYVQQLLDEDKAYYCFCSSERLDKLRKSQQQAKQPPKYDRCCLDLSKEEIHQKIDAGEKYVVRFKVPEGITTFKDEVFGKISVKNEIIDDQIIMKSDGFPTYHLAVVVDDYLMKISHIFRGVEWLPSTPKHILLYQALGWERKMPKFVHMANILNANKKKLSKREGSVSVEDFRKQGYPAEAIVNFIALLGWNPKTEQEIFSMQELIDQFDISKMNRAGGVFDLKRLDWISMQHIKKMSIDDLYEKALPFLREKDFYKIAPADCKNEAYIKKVLFVEKDRLEKFTQVGEENKFFFTNNIEIDIEDIHWKNSSITETKNSLLQSEKVLENITEDDWTLENIEGKLLAEAGDKRGDLLFPLRAVLTGEKKSPSPFEIAWVLGKEKSIERIQFAITKLK